MKRFSLYLGKTDRYIAATHLQDENRNFKIIILAFLERM